ncbi:MAG: type I 3-dehydroquinate dehydratase [Vicinamibacterales bacterium]
MHSLLCETVTGRTMAELVAARDAARGADMVELRLDGVRDLDIATALAGRRVPAIVTCRPTWEGGRFDAPEERRRGLLRQALDLGAEYVDVEWRADFDDLIRDHPDRMVVSAHDFAGVPPDLAEQARAMRQTGAAVIKVAVTPSKLSETLPLIDIARGGRAVVVGMGDHGVPSRLLATRFGSEWSYGGNAAAPGQIPVRRMVDEFRFQAIGTTTAIYGVVGNNVMHSLSPVMHNAAFAAAGIDAVYVPFPAADFEDFLTFASALGVSGASVTIPFKVDALTAAADADPLTETVGAANTLRREGVRWKATNTDVDGFLRPLDEVYPGSLAGARAAVIGAGGAARAVVVALMSRGARVTVHARRLEQSKEIAGVFGAQAGPWPPTPGTWDLLVNTTPLGGPTGRDASPLPGGPFDGRFVYDVTYGDHESPLVREAREGGCITLDGLPMLVAQAERQFEWWTGQRPGDGVMRAAAAHKMGAVA